MPSILTRPIGGGGAGGGSVSVVVSDSSPSIGDTITITGTASGFTPDNYYFVIDNGTDDAILIAEQSGNAYNWTIPALPLGSYTIYVFGVEDGTPDVIGGGIVDITISSDFLLDTTEGTGATFAFAFFRLRAGYTDPIALIRRSSDNAQKAFYFDSNGVLSLSSEDGAGVSLSLWIGSDNGYLVTGYSQDTSGLTFTASNAADQYMIISSGSLITVNGVVAIDGQLGDEYVISSSVTSTSAFIIAKNDALASVSAVFAGNGQGYSWGGTYSTITGIGMVSGGNVLTSVEDLNVHFASLLTDTGIYVDGNLEATGTVNDVVCTLIGGRVDAPVSGIGFDGKISVIVSYPTDKTTDRATIESIINSNFTPSIL